MGKSPGKWIKTVLLGKKHSKYNFSKNGTPDKTTTAKTTVEDLSQNSPVLPNPLQLTDGDVDTLELEKELSCSAYDATVSSPMNQDLGFEREKELVPFRDDDRRSRDRAAAKVQAALRGYLARRAFRALRGIIRLQALIRGHLVRRQAVATLHCVKAIVKLQSLARGCKNAKRVKIGAHPYLGPEFLATNTFVRQLLIKMPASVPLSLKCDVSEPNSAWSWLERWSVSRFWDPPARTKKITKSKPPIKHAAMQISEPEAGKSKRTTRRAPAAATVENGRLAFETGTKPRRNPGKLTNIQTESTHGHAQSQLERVKHNLRKVSSPHDVLELELAIPPENNPTGSDTVVDPVKNEQVGTPHSSINPVKSELVDTSHDSVDPVKNEPVDTPHDSVDHVKNELVDTPHDSVEPVKNKLVDNSTPHVSTHSVIEAQSIENGAKFESVLLNLDDELSVKEGKGTKDNLKIKKRRSLPGKHEFNEKHVQNNSLCLPSYMAATESAKAKLRANGSSNFCDDNKSARRYSLPASTKGKLSTSSPSVHKAVQGDGKGGTSFRDEKVVQPGWRR